MSGVFRLAITIRLDSLSTYRMDFRAENLLELGPVDPAFVAELAAVEAFVLVAASFEVVDHPFDLASSADSAAASFGAVLVAAFDLASFVVAFVVAATFEVGHPFDSIGRPSGPASFEVDHPSGFAAAVVASFVAAVDHPSDFASFVAVAVACHPFDSASFEAAAVAAAVVGRVEEHRLDLPSA